MKEFSILQLAEELEFKQTDSGTMGAYLSGELIGECEREALVHPEAMKAWQNEATFGINKVWGDDCLIGRMR